MQVCTVVAGKTASIASGNPFNPSTHAIRISLTPPLLEVCENLHPELRALVGLEPHAEHFELAVHPDRQSQITSAPLHAPAVTDLQDHAVKEHDGVDVLQRPGLPRTSVVHHRISDPADEVPPDFHAVDLRKVRFDIPRRQTTAIEREDLLVEPLEPALALADDLRVKRPVAVPRGVDRHRPVLGHQCLRRAPVPGVPGAAGRLQMRLKAQVVGELHLHRSLDKPLRQLRKQTARPDDLLLALGAGEQLIDHAVREKLPHPVR